MLSNGVGQNRETDEENDEDCVKKGFQLARVKFDRTEFLRKAVHILKTIFQCSYFIWYFKYIDF